MTDRSNKDSKKSPVKIRFKAMKDGRRSIYLDCYRNGHRSYEYLKLYLVPETDDTSLRLNEATMRKAETACRKKLRELKKLPVENRRIMETQGYISNKDISILEWLSRFKEIQRSRGVHDIHAIDLVCAILSKMNCGDTKVMELLFAELPEAEWTAEEEQRPAGREEALEPGDERYIVSGTIAEAEEQIIREAYGRYGGNMTEMARRLGIGRTTLWRKCKALGIQGT